MSRLQRTFVGLTAMLAVLVLAGCPGPAPAPPGDDEPRTTPIIVGEDDWNDKGDSAPAGTPGTGTYLLCFWNVENLFDDQDDDRHTRGDKEYDSWFAEDKVALKQKLDNLAGVILGMNDGKGPDILALAEVESARAAELVQQRLNAGLKDRSLHYTTVLFKNPSGGRHIATAILTRLPVEKGKTRLLGKRLRILQGQVVVADRPLTIIASHWSSRISDKTGATRGKYADLIYGHFKGMVLANPKVDFLVCGDFNDNPDDESVTTHLWATEDAAGVRSSGDEPKLFNLMGSLWQKGSASIYNRATPYLFDQICVSPGMLDDEGWSVVPDTARVVPQMAQANGRPNRFGGPKDRRPMTARGASDHFPVIVRLRVR
jgi:endonuclease/exonuclease/phosphatase family metal-dependent hydrolase